MRVTNKQAIEAQMAVAHLISVEMPVKMSLKFAQLAREIDRQVDVFVKVRDVLIKNYRVQILAGDKAGSVVFTTSEGVDNEQKEKALTEFMNKINELAETETEEIVTKVSLPDNINVAPDLLKPILPFLEGGE